MITIDIVSQNKKWKIHEKFIAETCEKLIPLTDLKKVLKKNISIELAILLVSDAKMKNLNNSFRNKNKVTNVLSFPAQESFDGKLNYVFLGDIILAFDYIEKESLAQNKTFENHLTHLILHSILHLIGFDHEEDSMAEIMENLEIKILKKLKISNPYIS